VSRTPAHARSHYPADYPYTSSDLPAGFSFTASFASIMKGHTENDPRFLLMIQGLAHSAGETPAVARRSKAGRVDFNFSGSSSSIGRRAMSEPVTVRLDELMPHGGDWRARVLPRKSKAQGDSLTPDERKKDT